MREVKDSGIAWVGKVPINWTTRTYRNVMIQRDGGAWGNDPSENDQTICLRIADFDYGKLRFKDRDIGNLTKRKYTRRQILNLTLRQGDILIEKSGGGEKTPVGRAVLFDKRYKALFANFMDRIRVNQNEVIPTFVTYWLSAWYGCKGSPYFINQTTGIQNIDLTLFLAKAHICYPALNEQQAIADFLDSKCVDIDSLSADIQKQIETLKEYKKSVITQAITKGLDPNAEMKNTVSPYWNQIPKTWYLSDIKYIFEIIKRIAGKEGYDILSVTQKGLKIKDVSNNAGQIAESYKGYQFVYPNDFVMNHMDLLTGWVDLSNFFGVTSPDYRVFKLRDNCKNEARYYKYIMQCCYLCRIFYSLGQGVSTLGRWRLQTSVFNNFLIPVPPIAEQKRIADFLDSKCADIDAAIAGKREQLEVLKEYKKSLIYEYVTGKKEVPCLE